MNNESGMKYEEELGEMEKLVLESWHCVKTIRKLIINNIYHYAIV